MYHLWYELVDGPQPGFPEGRIEIATTRPETLLGDTAVAANPEDERYKGLVGRRVRLPLTGRTIPVIADSYVDKAFGTGLVKITPAHDPNDFEVGKRHGLEQLNILNPDGTPRRHGAGEIPRHEGQGSPQGGPRGPQGPGPLRARGGPSSTPWAIATAAIPSSSPTSPNSGS